MYVTIKRNLTDCAKKIQYIWNNCIHIKSLNNLRNAVNSCLMKRIIIFIFILVFWPSRVIYSSVGYISIISNYRPGNFGECLSYSVYLYIYSLAISIKLPNCYFFFFFILIHMIIVHIVIYLIFVSIFILFLFLFF